MATYPLLFEGFELHLNTLTMNTFSALRTYMGTSVTDGEDADSVVLGSGTVTIDTTDQRITPGRSLLFTRPNDTGASLTNIPKMSFDFAVREKVAFGFGVKYEFQATDPIPLMSFNYDTAFGLEEQMSLWVSPNGQLFFATVDVATSTASQETLAAIPTMQSSTKAFVFGAWNYVEVQADYLAPIPTVTVRINGITVMDALNSLALVKVTGYAYVSNAAIYVPPMNWFSDQTSLEMHVDDIYLVWSDDVDDSALIGPQQILPLLRNAQQVGSSWAVTGNASQYIGGVDSIEADSDGDELIYNLTQPNAGIDGNITGVMVSALAENLDGLSKITFGGGDTLDVGGREFSSEKSLGPTLGTVLGRACTFGPVGVLPTTIDGMEAMFLHIKSGDIV